VGGAVERAADGGLAGAGIVQGLRFHRLSRAIIGKKPLHEKTLQVTRTVDDMENFNDAAG
jgi:hypothetical protein